MRLWACFIFAPIASLLFLFGNQSKESNENQIKCERPDCYQGLQISAKLDKETYKWNDAGKMTFTIKNVGDEPIIIYGDLAWGIRASLWFYITAVQGKTGAPSVLLDSYDRPPFKKETFITLKPNEFIELRKFF